MKNPRDVILAPVVSEKAYDLIEAAHTYTFEVHPRVSKTEVKQAVQAIFKVKVVGVNIMNRKGKRKRTGWTFGRRSDVKRALVTLAADDSIDIFGV
ncbi:MAG: 50S ribosomal protein L23 [Acidimicrobiia bacterium]|nr:50S ribosomal protein L23 [Acidimicrobiia bacterium]